MFEKWDWWNVGHGHYCVQSYGFVYSHSDANVNNKQKSFGFKKDDVLQFKFDSIKGKFTLTKNNSKKYEMNV